MLKRARSAITGRFVNKRRAKANPRTTVTETYRPSTPTGYVRSSVLASKPAPGDEVVMGWIDGTDVPYVAILLSPRVAHEYAHALDVAFARDAGFNDDARELRRIADAVEVHEEPFDD